MRADRSVIATAFRYFAAVAEVNSIRAAARRLNVAPSAINRQILIIERTLGIELFERIGRSLRLSEAGAILLRSLETMERRYEETLSTIDALRGLRRGKIRIATVESVSVALLPDLLAEFAVRYPGIEIAVTVRGSDAVADLVRQAEADLGFTFNPTSLEGLVPVYQRDLAIGALLSPTHPLAARRRLTLADCLQYPLALPSRGLSLRAILDTALSRMTPPPRPSFESNSLRLMSALVRRRRCIAFQTVIGIEQERAAGSLVLVPLNDALLPLDRFTVVHPAGRKPTLAGAAFLDLIARRLKPAAHRPGSRRKLGDDLGIRTPKTKFAAF